MATATATMNTVGTPDSKSSRASNNRKKPSSSRSHALGTPPDSKKDDDTSKPKNRSKTPPIIKRLMNRSNRSSSNDTPRSQRPKSEFEDSVASFHHESTHSTEDAAAAPAKTKRPKSSSNVKAQKPRRRSWGSMKDRVARMKGDKLATTSLVEQVSERGLFDDEDGNNNNNNKSNSDDEQQRRQHQKQARSTGDIEKQRRSRSRLRTPKTPASSRKIKKQKSRKNVPSKSSQAESVRDDDSGSVHEEDLNDDSFNNSSGNHNNNNNNSKSLSDSNHSRNSLSKFMGSSKRLMQRLRSRSRGRSMGRNSGHGSSSGSRNQQGGSKSPHSSKNSLGAVTITPSLYRRARKCRWDDVLEQCANDSNGEASVGAKFVSGKDGTTALHMAVMSRTGYIQQFKSSERELDPAPLSVLEALLSVNPDAAKETCTLNGYTPLVYACLVCSDTYQVEDAAKMVELFVQYCPEAFQVFTTEGLSALDVHIVSYSHHHKDKEEMDGLGRTSTAVLRLLLMHGAEHANLRLRQKVAKSKNKKKSGDDGGGESGNKKTATPDENSNTNAPVRTKTIVEGPIEYLYKCNADAFSKTVMEDIYDSDEGGSTWSDITTPIKRQKVVDEVSKWWVWKWAVMILKYGSLKQKRKGAKFAAVHTAAWQVGCPIPLLTITLYAFPRQVKETLESKDGVENLPIHLVCGWKCPSDESVVSYRKSQAIARLLEEYPDGAKKRNNKGETPLELALSTSTTWDLGIRRLVRAFPKAIKFACPTNGLYPFMLAAAAADTHHDNDETSRDIQAIRTIYGLLRSSPKVLINCFE